jgi:hypothetical protein
MNKLQSRFAVASVSSLSAFCLSAAVLVACAGSDADPIGAPAAASPSATGSSGSLPDPLDNSGNVAKPNPATSSSSSSSGSTPTSADAAPAPRVSMPRQGWTSSSQWGPLVALETAEGKAGDVVDLEVYLVGNDTCTNGNEGYGLIRFDRTYFELVNPVSQVDCTTRSQIPDSNNPGKDLITWQKFGNGSIAACPNPVGLGKVDVIKVRIKPGTPPGDYSFGWETSEFWGGTPACDVMGSHVGSEIRVLP